jgi:DNA-binding response OmpR family regulator
LRKPRSDTSTGRTAVVLGSATLVSLVALVFRHLELECAGVRTAPAARAALRPSPAAFIGDVIVPGALGVIAAASTAGVPTVALIDLERHASSFKAFVAGADQAIRIPFTPDELAVRFAALYRRERRPLAMSHVSLVGTLELSLDERVRVGTRVIRLDAQDNSLLYLLAARLGHFVRLSEIRRLVWGVERDEPDERVWRRVAALGRSLGAASIEIVRESDRVALRPRQRHE